VIVLLVLLLFSLLLALALTSPVTQSSWPLPSHPILLADQRPEAQ
jgi:hypothetical protein